MLCPNLFKYFNKLEVRIELDELLGGKVVVTKTTFILNPSQ